MKKQLDKLKKEQDDTIILKSTEYAEMIKKQKKEIEKSYQEGYDKYKSNFAHLHQLSFSQISHMLSVQNMTIVKDVLQIWMIEWVVKGYYMALSQTGSSGGVNLCFVEFWKDIFLSNVSKLSNPIFKIFLREWINLIRIIKKSSINIGNEEINICFSHFATNFMTDEYYEKSLVPIFFNMLFLECRNIPILLGLINFYQSKNNKLTEKEKEQVLRDFYLLFTVDKPEKILKANIDKIEIQNEAAKIFLK